MSERKGTARKKKRRKEWENKKVEAESGGEVGCLSCMRVVWREFLVQSISGKRGSDGGYIQHCTRI